MFRRIADFEKEYNTISHPNPVMAEIAEVLEHEDVSDDVGIALTSALVTISEAHYGTTDIYFNRPDGDEFFHVCEEPPHL